jgi:hypothetical protein
MRINIHYSLAEGIGESYSYIPRRDAEPRCTIATAALSYICVIQCLSEPACSCMMYPQQVATLGASTIAKLTLPLFSSQFHHPNFTMQKGDSPSHQNVGKCMKY